MPLNEVTGFSAKQSVKREMNGDESDYPKQKAFVLVEVLLFIMIILMTGTFHSVACDS